MDRNKYLLLLFVTVLFFACSSQKSSIEEVFSVTANYASDEALLKKNLIHIASLEFNGRETGKPGQKKASQYLANYYRDLGILSPMENGNYFQEIPKEFFNKNTENGSENVLAYIEGTDFPEEILVISAHYDHLGNKDGQIYFGADDDASGTVAVMEIARLFQVAKKDGKGPKRSILFLHVTGEEIGLFGSKYYTSHPIFPLNKTVANLNIDMIGRIDKKHEKNPNYIYLIGSDKLSTELHDLSEQVNQTTEKLDLDYTFNSEKDPNRFYYRSDHYNFAKNKIPVIFYFNGTHEDYHKPTDTADKINYELLTKRTNLIFYTAWEIVNKEGRIALNTN
ncbi:M28 family metallopeptidase [Namhaeicola litoreus]|uniref:M28 family metallopeptidase n=1 Tax=Namhaeicola litoreus TaxID=1052145 RepID=A0ABW3Y436_9FLAO